MALLDERSRSATARAKENTTVMEITRGDFEALIYKAPTLAYRIMRELSSRLRETDALLISYMQRKQRKISQAFLDTLLAVARALEARGTYSCGHTERVKVMAHAIGEELGLKQDALLGLEIGALLHDIGKIGISGNFFHKSGPLEDSEYDEIKKNPQKGKRLIEGVSFLEEVIPLAPYHHEWLIGSGCTARLKHSDIALLGRILAVADVFDALVSDRPDRKGLSVEKALSELEEQAGELFAPDVVESLSRLYASGRLYRAGQIE
jgi:HD-GYP domain-containing protein (c-di-GMP phosphodiesterase class II)